MLKVFSLALLAVVSAAQTKAKTSGSFFQIQQKHFKPNDNYDNSDAYHRHYGASKAASPAYPKVPEFSDAVHAYDTEGTLFGEHRYQLQVAKTGHTLMATDALRDAVKDIEKRMYEIQQSVKQGDAML